MRKLLFVLFILSFPFNYYASHYSSGSVITYNCLGGNLYEVTLTAYGDASAIVNPGATATIDFASSCSPNFSRIFPITIGAQTSQVCNPATGPSYLEYIFKDTVSLVSCSDWVISWDICCRNGATSNLINASSNSIYTQTTLNNVFAPCNNSPQPVSGAAFFTDLGSFTKLNLGATDSEGDSIVYSFTNSLSSMAIPISYSPGFSVTQPLITSSGVSLNQASGEMCFTPSIIQVCAVAILIEEYRNGVLISSLVREIQIVADNIMGSNQPPTPLGLPLSCGGNNGIATPTTQGPSVVQVDSNAFSMCPNDNICFSVDFSDFDGDSVNLSSNILSAFPNASFTVTGNGTLNAVGTFCWTPTASDVGVHFLIVTAEDNACPISANLTYVYEIEVFSSVQAGPDQTICGTQEAQLNAIGNGPYNWSVLSGDPIVIGSNFSCNSCPNPIAKPTITTAYLLTNNIGTSCQSTDTVIVTVAPDFSIVPTADTLICSSTSANIGMQTNTPGATYTINWSSPSTIANQNSFNTIATPTTSTVYYGTVTSSLGCQKVDSIKVDVAANPQLVILPGNSLICEGQSVNLQAEHFCAYTLKMYDNIGDGWNNQALQIVENGVVIGAYTVNTFQGDSNIVNFNIINGSNLDIVYSAGGGQNESSFELIDGNGVTQLQVAPGGMFGWTSNNIVYSNIVNCGSTNNSFSWSPGLSLNDSTISNPITTPLMSTTYHLTATDSIGCSFIDSINISLSNQIANFTFTDNGNGNYSFTNASTGSFTQSNWAFGDGSSSSTMNPTHTFAANGTYLVVLTINNSLTLSGNCIDYYTNTINVTGVVGSPTCNAGFTTYPDTNGVSVFNSSVGTGLTYLWDFDDGSSSTLQNPTHTYTTAGPFNLCLTIDNGNGCVDTYCDSIGANGTVFNKQTGFTINVTSPVVTGIENEVFVNSTISIYPNPTSNQLNILNNGLTLNQINIIDITGKKIKTINNNVTSINVADLSPGIYFVELITEEGSTIQKFVKQ